VGFPKSSSPGIITSVFAFASKSGHHPLNPVVGAELSLLLTPAQSVTQIETNNRSRYSMLELRTRFMSLLGADRFLYHPSLPDK
jgi:hypothetical protein